MSDNPILNDPSFHGEHPRGQVVVNDAAGFASMERHFPRLNLDDEDKPDGGPETDGRFIARAVAAGILLTVTSDEVHANPRILRDKITEAYERRLPLMKITGTRRDPPGIPTPDEAVVRAQAKLDALAKAREVIK